MHATPARTLAGMLLLGVFAAALFGEIGSVDAASGQASLTGALDARILWVKPYRWTIAAERSAVTPGPGAGGRAQVRDEVTLTRTEVTEHLQMDGAICLTNNGTATTDSLEITHKITQPPSTVPLAHHRVNMTGHPALVVGETFCYPFSLVLRGSVDPGDTLRTVVSATHLVGGRRKKRVGTDTATTATAPVIVTAVNETVRVEGPPGLDWTFTASGTRTWDRFFGCDAPGLAGETPYKIVETGMTARVHPAVPCATPTPTPAPTLAPGATPAPTRRPRETIRPGTVAPRIIARAETWAERRYYPAITATAPAPLALAQGATGTATFTTSTTMNPVDKFGVSGTVSVTNPNGVPVTFSRVDIRVSPGTSGGGICSGLTFPVTVAARGELICDFTITSSAQGNIRPERICATPVTPTPGYRETCASVSYSFTRYSESDKTINITNGANGPVVGTVTYNQTPLPAGTSIPVSVGPYATCGTFTVPRTFYAIGAQTTTGVGSTANATVNVTGCDETAPVSSTTGGPASPTSTLSWNFGASATDAVDLASVSLYAQVPGAGSYTLIETVTVSGTSASPAFSAFIPSAGDGAYRFYTRATDASGNTEAAPGAADIEITLDTTAAASSTTGGPGALTNTLSWSFGASATDAVGLGSVALYVQAPGAGSYTLVETVPAAGTSAAPAFAAYVPADGDGIYRFYTRATDGLGNIEAAPGVADIEITLDTAPPTAVTTGGPSSLTNTLSWSFGATAADGSALTSVSLYVETPTSGSYALVETVAATGTLDSPSFAAYVPADGDGVYRFYTRATDAAGNTEAAPGAADIEITLDTAAPTASSVTITDMSTTLDTGDTITVVFSEAMDTASLAAGGSFSDGVLAGFGSFAVGGTNGGTFSVAWSVGDTTATVTLTVTDGTLLPLGDLSVEATATDAAGNALGANATTPAGGF